jgi:hypothetical protein
MTKTGSVLLMVALGVVGMEFYTRIPLDAPAALLTPDIPANTRTVALVVHGSVDSDNPQFPAIVVRLEAHYAAAGETDFVVRFLRWSPWSDQRLRAAATAEQLGERLGERIARLRELENLHLVVHSSGAYVADTLCESYRRNLADSAAADQPARRAARVTMVFLDPFQLRGFVDWRHGTRNHGRCADFALAIINTDDPAPTTNSPLLQAWNIDVTRHAGAAAIKHNGHYWPPQYYLEFLPGLERAPLELSHERYPRGGVLDDPSLMGSDMGTGKRAEH